MRRMFAKDVRRRQHSYRSCLSAAAISAGVCESSFEMVLDTQAAMTASEVALAVEGVLYGGGTVEAVSTDSRSIPEKSLFVPLKGERFDGHAYMDAALEKGAAGCLCSTLPEIRQAICDYPDGREL